MLDCYAPLATESQLVVAAAAGIALVLYLIIGARLHAFVALLTGSLAIGAMAGMPFTAVLDSVANGVGSTLASIAALVGLGAMFGRMLEVSGGAEALAASLLARSGARHAPWPLVAIGLIVAIPVFFDVAFIVLVSIVYGLTEKTGRPIVYYAVPLLAGLAVAHAFIPPTPGPIAVAGVLGADLGLVMLFGALVGIPAAIVAGPLYGRFIAKRVPHGNPVTMHAAERPEGARPPLGLVAALIALPLVMIVGNTVGGLALEDGGALRSALALVGHPMVALLVTTLLSFGLLGTRAGYSREQVREIATRALEPAGIVILVTGAGGALKQVLVDSGVGKVLADELAATALPSLVLAFVVAAAVRIMQGSATVAMLTAAGLVAALVGELAMPKTLLALHVVAIAAGATIASHVNDSGFWLVNRYLGLSVPDTLKTWTALTTIASVTSIALVLLVAALI
jgi:Gnt-I system low-affinity gluconate transporter